MDELYKLYGEDQVEIFFDWARRYQTKARIDIFIKYHTKEVLDEFMTLFPPPSLLEIWNRWVNLKQNV